ncbi:hypothetical protein Sfulv_37510 [Streptomyces fulvorobeus]|uniref:Peptidoglycan recognition protein family domain-containing protein n=1 Tax=Streptomyces fulvorobeus TaxID=284028 RepID=A0A7J0C8T5_9ACTN|nr:hypothetical protein Sfulv_37510 [Streptomyces fulvorobeus]
MAATGDSENMDPIGNSRPAQAHTLALDGKDHKKRSLPRTETQSFSLVGVSWDDSADAFEGTAQIRTRDADDGTWTEWSDLDFDIRAPESAEGRDSGVRGASEPLWVGPSDAIEARVLADGEETAVPKALRIDMIDPGTVKGQGKGNVEGDGQLSAMSKSEKPTTDPSGEPSSVPDPRPTASESPTPDPSVSTGPTTPAAPQIVSRAEWGADESLVTEPPSYLAKVDAVFVHHTAGTNSYECAESPAIIRAILTYHVKSNGWSDTGYNFFVDKCGTVFEGRAGGTDKPVRGAHTYGFNGYSAGVSLLGDYENGGTPTAAAKQAIADVSAWKLGLHGVDPQAQVTLTAAGDTGVYKTGDRATLHTVSGHRDGYATLCPGAALYSELPEIRRTAGDSVYAAN